MKAKKRYQKKVEKIEELVEHDLSNGRQVQKRIQRRLELLGLTPEDVSIELQHFKSE